ncbi:TetR/AcrR family transcriptional regulator [Serratia marcescens]|uniref:TetR/AcrR family transcriptional regulator n=1 Tax=Serratia marcescens TaxID=615 RepID=UPI0032046FD7
MQINENITGREPQQERGRQRVQTILDSAAAIVAQDGLAALSMQRLAKHAKTSIGSMYHFFPDRHAVIKALADRHTESIEALVRDMALASDDEWRRLSAEAVIQRLFSPYAQYLREHADYLPVMREMNLPDEKSSFLTLIASVLQLRRPETAEAEILQQTRLLQSLVAGTLHHIFKTAPQSVAFTLAELPGVLSLYLAGKEGNIA